MSERKRQNIRYWNEFCNHLRQQGSQLKPLTPLKSDYKHYRDFQIGIPGFAVKAAQRVKKGLQAQFIIRGRDAITYYDALMEQQSEIHRDCGERLFWFPANKEKSILFEKMDADPTAEKDWPNQHKWLAIKLEKLNEVFRPRIERIQS